MDPFCFSKSFSVCSTASLVGEPANVTPPSPRTADVMMSWIVVMLLHFHSPEIFPEVDSINVGSCDYYVTPVDWKLIT